MVTTANTKTLKKLLKDKNLTVTAYTFDSEYRVVDVKDDGKNKLVRVETLHGPSFTWHRPEWIAVSRKV